MQNIVKCTHKNLIDWLNLRKALWPESSETKHLKEISEIIESQHHAAFMFKVREGEYVSLIELSLRFDYVNGCETSPVAFLEGIYTTSSHRQQGIANMLISHACLWAKEHNCQEIASDTHISNLISQKLHHFLTLPMSSLNAIRSTAMHQMG